MSATDEELVRTEKAKPKRPKSLWLNLDYMLLWSGQMVSNVGTQVSTLAFPLLILALTRSPAQAGFAGALRALPYVIFSLPAGALIDRWDRKRVMILCDTGRAISMASIPVALLLGHLTILQIYLVSLIEGTLFVFFNIAEAACLPRVVPKEQLPAATAQNMATDGITLLLGPSLGGALYSAGRLLPFVADAVSYVVSVISLFFIKAKFQKERVAARRKLWIEIREGLSWLWHQPLIRFIAILTGGNNLISSGGLTLIIIVLAQQQHASSFTIGLIFAVGGIGAILGSLIATPLQKRLSFGQAIIGTSWVFAIFIPLYIIAPNPLILGIITAASFFAGPIYNVVQFSYRSAIIPDELQGRVNSVFRLIAFGGQPLGLALTGLLIENIGVIPTLLVDTVGMVILAIAATVNTHVRNAKPLSEIENV
ncbi:MAG TPA: MFS transporter [Ktedonobacteraceae bacterium]|nr:MFS transporter [Ktedonobacteraceae bacterium]